MQRICVYCGSNFGTRDSYVKAAQSLGTEMAANEITLVYGGGNVGLMGTIADTVIASGGQVIGVMPQALVDKEIATNRQTHLKIILLNL